MCARSAVMCSKPTALTRTKRAGGVPGSRSLTKEAPICWRAVCFSCRGTPSSISNINASTWVRPSALSIIFWRWPGTNIQERRSSSLICVHQFSVSVGLRQSQDFVSEERQDQIITDRRDGKQSRLPELSFHVVFARKTIPAVEIG